jgi:hypothetical protein
MAAFLSILLVGLGIIGLCIHLITLLLIFSYHGFFGALVSLLMPVISEIYMFIVSWRMSGTIFTKYNVLILVYVISFIIWWILLMAVNFSEEKKLPR